MQFKTIIPALLNKNLY